MGSNPHTKITDMILTCGDWFFNKMEKRTMQADKFDVADLWQNWSEPTPLLASDLEKNGFKLEEVRQKVYYSKYINNIKGIFVENDLKSICVATLCFDGVWEGISYFIQKDGLQVHELQQFLRLCGYEDIADNFVL